MFCTTLAVNNVISLHSDATMHKCVFTFLTFLTVERQELLQSMCHSNKLCSFSLVCNQISPAIESQLITDRDLIQTFSLHFRLLPG